MATCTVRWRSSGGRGEFEYVPADTLEDRTIDVFIESLGLRIPAEVRGVKAQGKPRLRKFEKNNKKKFHLPQLVMAVARLPEPARQDHTHTVAFPLKNKAFIMDSMDFDVIEDDGINATLAPLRVSIRNSQFEIDLQDRFDALAADLEKIESTREDYPEIADAIEAHAAEVMKGVNSIEIRKAADRLIGLQDATFGMTNAGSVSELKRYEERPESELEDIIEGKEGRLLTRIHSYKERDKNFARKVKSFYKSKNGGRLVCEACGVDPVEIYGANGERCIEAHHRVPISELQPDSVTCVSEMAILCANCHRVVHSEYPCLSVEQARELVRSAHQDSTDQIK
jgi:predicted HNH restriction endonuclease